MAMQRAVNLSTLALAAATLAACQYLAPFHHDPAKYKAVFAAADACDLPAVKMAVEQQSGLLRATEWDGATLLHDAAAHRCDELAAFLLTSGANPNAAQTDGETPLHIAAQRGDLTMIGALLAHGAHVNAVDGKSWTPLDRANRWSHPSAVAYLASHGGKTGGAPPQ